MLYQSKTVKITYKVIENEWKNRKPKVCTTIRDSECRGLALVVNPTVMVWRFTYHPRGVDPATGKRFATRTVALGVPDGLSIMEARVMATRMKGEIKAGRDPIIERQAMIEERRSKLRQAR